LQDERETLHVADDARRVAMVETLTVSGGAVPVGTPVPRYRFQLDNHLGTACVEVDQAGAVISYEEYHPYGTSAYRSFQSSEVSAKRYRYTGKERDEETGLYYHGARYYAPWLGRWAQADPMGTVDGTNLYAYVRGSPVGLRDPSGRQGVVTLPEVQIVEPRPELESTGAKGVKIEPTGEGEPAAGGAGGAPPSTGAEGAGPGQGDPLALTPAERRAAAPSGYYMPYEELMAPTESIGPEVSMPKWPIPAGTFAETKREAVAQALHERAKAAGIHQFNEEAFSAFLLLTAIAPPIFEVALETLPSRAAPMAIRSQPPLATRSVPKGQAAGVAESAVPSDAMRGRFLDVLGARARQLQLGTDVARGGQLNPAQGAAGVRMEQALGRSIRPGTHPGVDFVDELLGDISLKGPIPARGSVRGLTASAIDDLQLNTATHVLFVDLAGLTAEQAAQVQASVSQAAINSSKRVFFLR